MAKNYYVILGVDADATPEQIKSAYRRLVQEFHPDHYGEDSGPFLAIQEAHAVLSDPARRRAYDQSLRSQSLPPTSRQAVTEVRRPRVEPLAPDDALARVSLTRSFQTFFPSFDEIFDRLWSNFRDLTRPKSERIESLTVEIPITPLQAFRGGHVRILVPAQAKCPTCRGEGWVGLYECWRCAGEGEISGEFPVFINLPAGTPNNYAMQIPLDRFGIRNFYLTAIFKVGGLAE
jgi:molecular chaperone DnaJ